MGRMSLQGSCSRVSDHRYVLTFSDPSNPWAPYLEIPCTDLNQAEEFTAAFFKQNPCFVADIVFPKTTPSVIKKNLVRIANKTGRKLPLHYRLRLPPAPAS